MRDPMPDDGLVCRGGAECWETSKAGRLVYFHAPDLFDVLYSKLPGVFFRPYIKNRYPANQRLRWEGRLHVPAATTSVLEFKDCAQ